MLENVGRRTYATLAIAPFVALGIADVLLLLMGGTDPLWGFLILPPILFITAIGWIGFKSGFVGHMPAEEGDDADRDAPAEEGNDADRGAPTEEA